jgi:hypothetical protein
MYPATPPTTAQQLLSCWLVEAKRIFLQDTEADPRVGIPDRGRSWTIEIFTILTKLGCMRSVDLGTEANVALTWESYKPAIFRL